MDFELTGEQKQLVQQVDRLVKERLAARAADYDRSNEFPVEDIQDLYREGWLLANLERRYGGLGYGLDGDDPLAFFLLIEHLAHGNPSTAHCFQVHNNTLMMVNAKEPYRQLRAGELKSLLDASRLLLYHAVTMYKHDPNKAMVHAHAAKWMVKETLYKVMAGVVELAGSTSLFEMHPQERFCRDMHVHMLHGRHDIAAQIVGAAEFGEPYDVNRTH